MDFPIVLRESLFPVQAFFNAMPARSLIRTLAAFCDGVGAGFNDAVCEFPDELEEGEVRFDGVRFEIFNESATISNLEFLDIVSRVCAIYAEQYPAERDIVRDMVERLTIRLRDDYTPHAQ
ncbi:hypothetical protein [Chitinimonas lacunae]|uniref:CDI immunity protein domain-containing protein n=1 Tax=Chitinimonas lacunae TaxID=1963018 RepID=A0ABV8MPI6_9NEIS